MFLFRCVLEFRCSWLGWYPCSRLQPVTRIYESNPLRPLQISTKVLFRYLQNYYVITKKRYVEFFPTFTSSKSLCVLVLFHVETPSGPSHIESKVQFCLCGGQRSCHHIVRRVSMSCTDFIKTLHFAYAQKKKSKV